MRLLPDGDARHDKALLVAVEAIGANDRLAPTDREVWTTQAEAAIAAYLASLAEQGARFVEVNEAAEWLDEPERVAAVWQGPPLAEAFLRRFGGGDGGMSDVEFMHETHQRPMKGCPFCALTSVSAFLKARGDEG